MNNSSNKNSNNTLFVPGIQRIDPVDHRVVDEMLVVKNGRTRSQAPKPLFAGPDLHAAVTDPSL